jgi:membrane-bound serine protease (ClpP class)
MRRILAAVVLLSAALLGPSLAFLAAAVAADAAADPAVDAPVLILTIDGEIDLGLAALTERAVREAEETGAAALIVRIDTPGGRLDAALRMRDALLGAAVRTIAFVDRDAFSAGALVAIAAEDLWLAPGAVIGAATPVLGDGSSAEEKTVSAVRAVFRATALERGRDPLVAEAMVDPALVVDGLVRRGELLTLDVAQAQVAGYGDGVATDLDALLAALDLTDRPRVDVTPALAERLVRVLTSSIVAGLLLTVGIWLLVGDVLGGGGLGLGAALGSLSIATFLFGHLLAGLAGWEAVLLVVLGIVLILLEVLVLPGVGVAGIAGVLSLLAGAVLAMVDRQVDVVPRDVVVTAFNTALLSVLAAFALIFAAVSLLSRRSASADAGASGAGGSVGSVGSVGSLGAVGRIGAAGTRGSAGAGLWRGGRRGGRLVLSTDVGGAHEAGLVGRTGIALTDLRPAGAAEIDGLRVDVVAEAGYLSAGTPLEIVVDEGYRRVVRARAGLPAG